LAAAAQEVGKRIRFRSEIANAEWTRQGRRMKQDAAGSGKVHLQLSSMTLSQAGTQVRFLNNVIHFILSSV
jgi:hypothetical protein